MNISVASGSVMKRLDVKLKPKIEKALGQIASEGARGIESRGLKGRGYKGSFKAYLPEYAKFRKKKGRKIAPVDLNFTGQMWAALTSKTVSDKSAEIYFTSKDANKKAYFNNKKRPFFGFNSKDKRKFRRFFEDAIKL